MEAIEASAQFDNEGKLKVDKFPKFKNRKARVIILLTESENEDWYSLSYDTIARAYAQDEPDYQSSLIKEPNEAYGS